MKAIPLLSISASLCSLAFGGVYLAFRGVSRVAVLRKDFGDVAPQQTLNQVITFDNSEGRPVLLAGFEEACGVSATLLDNDLRLVQPGERRRILLTCKTNRLQGPTGVAFNLIEKSDQRVTKQTRYELTWNVVASAWFDKSEVWMPDSGDPVTVRLVNSKDSAKIFSIRVPDNVEVVRRSATDFAVRTDPGTDGPLGDIVCSVGDSNRQLEYRVQAHRYRDSKVALYPKLTFLTKESPTGYAASIHLVENSNLPTHISVSDPSVHISQIGNRIQLATNADVKGPVYIRVKGSDGNMLAESCVYPSGILKQ
ncbi:MAG TPA: hypothetical protein VG944_12370 [Fimbriimonas sp.]|nr:hypothetical protein [Fimbriimonas sp.]